MQVATVLGGGPNYIPNGYPVQPQQLMVPSNSTCVQMNQPSRVSNAVPNTYQVHPQQQSIPPSYEGPQSGSQQTINTQENLSKQF